MFGFVRRISTMARKFCVGGNWKMNGDKKQITEIVNFLKAGPLDPNTEVVVGVPAPYLDFARTNLPANVEVAAQNCYKVAKGAFTGIYAPRLNHILFLVQTTILLNL